jgi:hypothetical protein
VRRLEADAAVGGGPLGDLPAGDLADLLGRLLGDEADLSELLDRLMTDEGGLGDLLGDGGLGDLLGDGGLADLLSGDMPGAACLTPTGGLLDGLLDRDREPLPEEPEALVQAVADQVAEMRELEWDENVEVAFVDGAELSDRLEVLLAEDADPEGLAAQERMLAALGAIPEDLDLETVQRELLEEQVAGYYAPDTGELVVRVPDDGVIRPMERVTLAHELEHALADQALGLPDVREEPYASDADAALGAIALIEGDATLLMNRWALEHLSLGDQLSGLLGGDLDAAQASLDTVPHHLQRELLFPYTDGLGYVCALYQEGGWAAVDERYGDPPTTSAAVLDPRRDGEEPRTPASLTAPADGQELLDTTFGAAPLQWLLEAPGGSVERALDEPRERAAVWDGGRVTLWEVDGDTVLGLAFGDQGSSHSLCSSLAGWHAAAFPAHRTTTSDGVRLFRGDERSAALRCDDEDVRYASAPSLGIAYGVVGLD